MRRQIVVNIIRSVTSKLRSLCRSIANFRSFQHRTILSSLCLLSCSLASTMTTETRTPAEILSEIFHLLCDEPIALEELENSSCLNVFPWAVGQACRRWRTTFLSDPHLWTSLSLHSNPLQDHSAAYLAEMNRRSAIYLKRSGQLPLTIAITPEYSILTIWKMLLSCLNRWRKAEIILSFSTGSVIDGFLECRGRFPIFEPDVKARGATMHLKSHRTLPNLIWSFTI